MTTPILEGYISRAYTVPYNPTAMCVHGTGTGQERLVKSMEDVSTKAAHEQAGISEEPVLPPKLDIQQGYEEESEVAYTARIKLGRRIPHDGPEDPRMRVQITYVVLLVWVMWVVFGFIRLSLTGDKTMLLAAPILILVPLSVVLKYYFGRKRPKPGGRHLEIC